MGHCQMSSVEVPHESLAVAGDPEKFLDTINRPDIVLKIKFCACDVKLAHVGFRCRARLFVAPCPADIGYDHLEEMVSP